MADDPLDLEAKLRENAERMEEVRRQLAELEDADMGKNDQLQMDLDRLIEKRNNLNEFWEKSTTGQSPER